MSLPYRQRHRLRRLRRGLSASDPQLAAMLVMFAALHAGDPMPGVERVRRRPPRPVLALTRAGWAFLRCTGRALLTCARALLTCARALRPCGRLLRLAGRALRRLTVSCLLAGRCLPAGFRLTVGAWLVARHRSASVPTAHRRNR